LAAALIRLVPRGFFVIPLMADYLITAKEVKHPGKHSGADFQRVLHG